MDSSQGFAEPSPFAAGQRWIYRSAPGLESSRLIIGAIVTFNGGRIYCCSITYAGRAAPDGSLERVHIPFLPFTEPALIGTVLALDGMNDLPPTFAQRLQEWAEDPRGMSTFTVPFDGFLDHLISQQVARIAGVQAA
jgi:hypothetical protein